MILRTINEINKKLYMKMNVREFIKEIIEQDKDRLLKRYIINLNNNEDMKNLSLYYQYGVLKSHHTSGYKMDYLDYLDCEIRSNYTEEYIKKENIISFDLDFISTEEPKGKTREEISDIIKNLEINSNEYREKRQFEQQLERKILYGNLECISKMELDLISEKMKSNLQELNKKKLEIISLKQKLERTLKENERLEQRIKWIEYTNESLNKEINHSIDRNE